MRRTGLLAAVAASAVIAVGGAALSSADDGMQPLQAQPMASDEPSPLAQQLAEARLATQQFALGRTAARRAGYVPLTPMMPNMGYHVLNPRVSGFDVTKPPILVYVQRDGRWQLGALEWVFAEKPETPPLPGAEYGAFGAACHYVDGTFVFADAEADCPRSSPETGKKLRFWHPDLVTMHVWLWYPNPDGLFAGTNPLVAPFNEG